MSKNRKFLQCRARTGQHECEAAQAEEEQRLLQGLLRQQKLEFPEAHQRGLYLDGKFGKFQSSVFRDYGKTKIYRGSEHYIVAFRPSTGTEK